MYKPPLRRAVPPPYVCARGVIDGDGTRFGKAHPRGSEVGGRHERRGLAAAVRFSFPARPPPRRWPRVAGRMGGPGPGWVGVFCWACFHLWFIFPCVVIRFCYDSNSRLTTFPSSSNVSPLSVASSPAWARAWHSRQSNSRLSSLSAISGLLIFSGVRCSLW